MLLEADSQHEEESTAGSRSMKSKYRDSSMEM